MTRRPWKRVLVVSAAVFVATVLTAVWFTRSDTPLGAPVPTVTDPTLGATPTPTVEPAPTPGALPAPPRQAELTDLAGRYVKAYQAGRTTGGAAWTSQLAKVASPDLVKAVSFTDPALIPTAPVTNIAVEQAGPDGTGLVRVTFRGGGWLLLHTAPNPAGGLWVVAVEGSKVTPTP